MAVARNLAYVHKVPIIKQQYWLSTVSNSVLVPQSGSRLDGVAAITLPAATQL